MIVSLLIGRKGSQGFPKKNLIRIKNKYIFEYPIASKKVKLLIKFMSQLIVPLYQKFVKKNMMQLSSIDQNIYLIIKHLEMMHSSMVIRKFYYLIKKIRIK